MTKVYNFFKINKDFWYISKNDIERLLELSLLESFSFSCSLSLFFLDEKSNQKNQVLCISSKFFAKNSVGAKKTHRLRQTQTIFRFIRLHFCKNLNFYKAHPKRIDF